MSSSFRARLLRDDKLAEFWSFITVPRSATVAARESLRLRGAWATEQLMVQKVHGYSLSSVRLLCVVAGSEDERQRLRDFIARDVRNMRTRLKPTVDPLDEEQRVLLKVPYDPSLDAWVEHEAEVLRDLQDVPGIPRLHGTFFFTDVGVKALALDFTPADSIQNIAGTHVGVYRMACFFLRTLEQVHQRGWIHADLQPKDLLLVDPSAATATIRQSEVEEEATGLICGWSRACRGRAQEIDLAKLLPLQRSERCVHLTSLRSPSVFSAPEQYVSLYCGEDLETVATDLYRLGAIAATALRLRPVPECTALRRLCHEALVNVAAEEQIFTLVQQLMVEDLGSEGLAPWLQRLIARPAAFGSAAEALEGLKEAWAEAEPQLIAAAWSAETPDLEKPQPPYLELKTPELLAGMSIV